MPLLCDPNLLDWWRSDEERSFAVEAAERECTSRTEAKASFDAGNSSTPSKFEVSVWTSHPHSGRGASSCTFDGPRLSVFTARAQAGGTGRFHFRVAGVPISERFEDSDKGVHQRPCTPYLKDVRALMYRLYKFAASPVRTSQ